MTQTTVGDSGVPGRLQAYYPAKDEGYTLNQAASGLGIAMATVDVGTYGKSAWETRSPQIMLLGSSEVSPRAKSGRDCSSQSWPTELPI